MNEQEYKANLRVWIERANETDWNEGMNWYRDAQKFTRETAEHFDVNPAEVAAVVSALSPNNRWERNKIDAFNIVNAYKKNKNAYEVKVCTYNANKHKAIRILREGIDVLKDTSPKTYSFAKNVGELNPKYITIDKWHLRACETIAKDYTKTRTTLTPLQYKKVQDWTYDVAKEYNLLGFEFQAIVWVTIKRTWEQ